MNHLDGYLAFNKGKTLLNQVADPQDRIMTAEKLLRYAQTCDNLDLSRVTACRDGLVYTNRSKGTCLGRITSKNKRTWCVHRVRKSQNWWDGPEPIQDNPTFKTKKQAVQWLIDQYLREWNQ